MAEAVGAELGGRLRAKPLAGVQVASGCVSQVLPSTWSRFNTPAAHGQPLAQTVRLTCRTLHHTGAETGGAPSSPHPHPSLMLSPTWVHIQTVRDGGTCVVAGGDPWAPTYHPCWDRGNPVCILTPIIPFPAPSHLPFSFRPLSSPAWHAQQPGHRGRRPSEQDSPPG